MKKMLFFSMVTFGLSINPVHAKTRAKIKKIITALPPGATVELSKNDKGKVVEIGYRYNKALIRHLLGKATGMTLGLAGVVLGVASLEIALSYDSRQDSDFSNESRLIAFLGAGRGSYFDLANINVSIGASGLLAAGGAFVFAKNLYGLFKGYGVWERVVWATLDSDGMTFHEQEKRMAWSEMTGVSLWAQGTSLTLLGRQEDVTCEQLHCPVPFDVLLECLKIYVPEVVDRKISC